MTQISQGKRINYEIIPEHCRDGMKSYIEEGVPPGDFLQAVISDKLVDSFARADDTNLYRIKDYAYFMYNEMPLSLRGVENMKRHIARKQEEREFANVGT